MSTKKWKAENQDKIRGYRRKWYANNQKRARAAVVARKDKLKIWLSDYKKNLVCKTCGESRWYVLEFHHRDPDEKEKAIGQMLHDGWSREKIMKEIEKCDTLCANCHRELHYLDKIASTC